MNSLSQLTSVVFGTVQGADASGRPLVTWSESDRGPVVAQPVWLPVEPTWSECRGLRCVLAFRDGDHDKPVLLGLLDAPPVTEPEPSKSLPKKLTIASSEDLTIKCGKASLSLRADGKIEILGNYVITRSRGVNRIKGGSVHIN